METIAVDIDEVLTPCGLILYDDTEYCLNALKKNFNLEIVTARNPRRIEETVGWLALQLPDVFSGVHFIRQYQDYPEPVTKAQVCEDIGAKYLIDDLEEHCLVAAQLGITALYFGGYSQKPHENIVPVQGWGDILRYFTKRC